MQTKSVSLAIDDVTGRVTFSATLYLQAKWQDRRVGMHDCKEHLQDFYALGGTADPTERPSEYTLRQLMWLPLITIAGTSVNVPDLQGEPYCKPQMEPGRAESCAVLRYSHVRAVGTDTNFSLGYYYNDQAAQGGACVAGCWRG